MVSIKYYIGIALSLVLLMPGLSLPAVSSEVTATFTYRLSNFTGVIPYSWPEISVDNQNREVYVTSGDGVRIFNEHGMEVYRFGYHGALASIYDVTVNSQGNILLLAERYVQDQNAVKRAHAIDVYDYKGEPAGTITLDGLPAAFSGFRPTRVVHRDGLLYLAELQSMKVVVADGDGRVQDTYDLMALIGLTDKKKEDAGIVDFSVDRDGNILFTVPVLAKAYRVTPERQVDVFGERGSAPGRFGIPGGIVADHRGHYLVADTLRSVVLVFDRDFKFITEFGYRGPGPSNLVGPKVLAVDDSGKLYISQLGNRGVSVFQLAYP